MTESKTGRAFTEVIRLNQNIMELQTAIMVIRRDVGEDEAAGTLRSLEALIDEKIAQIKIARAAWNELAEDRA